MKVVVMELADTGQHMMSLSEVEPPGSLSSHEQAGRQIYIFGWHEGSPGVWRSLAGFDVETPAFREIAALGLERLADLTTGHHEQTIVHRSGVPVRLRFRLDERELDEEK